MLRALTTLALLLTPPGTPSGGFHWQRIITPPAAAPTAQACVVLDAATFANAAPALGDLRLFQDGNELPYVIEESYDDRALTTGTTPDDDRSEYEAVSSGPLDVKYISGSVVIVGHPANNQPRSVLSANLRLPARVPVERIRFDPAPKLNLRWELSATEGKWHSGAAVERAQGTLASGQSSIPFTIGANLQKDAAVALTLRRLPLAPNAPVQVANALADGLPTRVVLEMRRRSLCYQPRSASPLVLYFGGGQGIAAKVYGPSRDFTSALERPYATLGPLEPNPDQQHRSRHPISRLLLGAAVLAATLLLTLWVGLELLRKEKSRPQAAQSKQ